jgi:hypothetical protein
VLASQLSVKLYAANTPASLEPLVPIFHRWIRDKQHKLNGKLLIDVTDYRHVKDGPGVMLIGHEAHWGVGHLGGDGLGLVYGRKRDAAGELPGKLAEAFHDALTAAVMLEGEADLGLAFDGGRARVQVMSRLHAANDAAGFTAAKDELEAFGRRLWGEASLRHVADDPRTALTIDVTGKPATVTELLARLR